MENYDRLSAPVEARFDAYLDRLSAAVGHADRTAPLRGYCTGLLLPGERKSVEPMAARIAPRRVSATHQSLHHFVAKADWSDAALLAAVRDDALPAMTVHEPIRAWIVDDTGLPKQGKHSVGVARQYCGQLGKTDNCQVAVTLSLANPAASLPVAYRLYLPEDWAEDAERRRKAGVPEDLPFQTKPAIALSQIEAALAAGLPQGVVLADAGYGNETAFRDQLTAWDLPYAVGIQPSTTVYRSGSGPLPPAPPGGRGRKASRWRRNTAQPPLSVKQLALELPPEAWQTVVWREGSHGELASRFAAVRVRAAHDDRPRAEEWLLVEWPEDEAEPTRYWLATLPADLPLTELVATAKLRWRIERDYRELKQEMGLGHFEGRGWRGFHHHASLCIAAYGFLVAERGAFPPSGVRAGALFEAPAVPADYRPRGAAAAGAAAPA